MTIKTVYVDTETCGLSGVPVLLQYAVDDGLVKIVHLWSTPIREIMELIEFFVDNRVVAHNLRFDWFHLSKLYGMCAKVRDTRLGDIESCLSYYDKEYLVYLEWESQFGHCLKPRAAVDTLILAQRGEAQAAVMDANAIYIRQIPRTVAPFLMAELESRLKLPWILFARQANVNAARWRISERKDDLTGAIEADWVDLTLPFFPSNGLKPLAKFLLNWESPTAFDDIAPSTRPGEEGFAPFAKLLSSGPNWEYKDGHTWPALIDDHIEHWRGDASALAYAEDDIHMLRGLYEFFGSPEDDRDSILACQVASVRLKGFSVDLEGMEKERVISQAVVDNAPVNVNSPLEVKAYIAEALDDMEQVIVAKSAAKAILKSIIKEFTLETEEPCVCDSGCIRCDGKGVVGPGPMPVVDRVQMINEVRKHGKRVELYNKILLAGRAYPDFNVIGAKSGRMSGASGLNFHGIAKVQEVRELFTCADEGEIMAGGDYESQELAILATTSKDMVLLEELKGGKSLHGLMGAELYGTTYEDIMDNKDYRYENGKSANYLIAYGGTAETMANNLGLPLDVCQKGLNGFLQKYAQMGIERVLIAEEFTSMKQEGGKIEYDPPDNPFVESIYGFRRFFTNEYSVQESIITTLKETSALWETLGVDTRDHTIMYERRKGKCQNLKGVIASALFGTAFSIQNGIIRAALNHCIQSAGRSLTLGLQGAVWDVQPQGIHPFKLRVFGVHDESIVVTTPAYAEEVKQAVLLEIRKQHQRITMISLTWGTGLDNWHHLKHADADNCSDLMKCGFTEKREAQCTE